MEYKFGDKVRLNEKGAERVEYIKVGTMGVVVSDGVDEEGDYRVQFEDDRVYLNSDEIEPYVEATLRKTVLSKTITVDIEDCVFTLNALTDEVTIHLYGDGEVTIPFQALKDAVAELEASR